MDCWRAERWDLEEGCGCFCPVVEGAVGGVQGSVVEDGEGFADEVEGAADD